MYLQKAVFDLHLKQGEILQKLCWVATHVVTVTKDVGQTGEHRFRGKCQGFPVRTQNRP